MGDLERVSGVCLDFSYFHLFCFGISDVFMLVGKCHLFRSALRIPLAGQGGREESQLGPLPPQQDPSDILRCLIHEVTQKNSFHGEGSTEGK